MELTAATMIIGQECHGVLSSQEWETVLALDNNQPKPPTIRCLEVQPYNAAALSDCRSVLEEVDPWGLVCYLLVLGVLSIQD
jgi:hypothetical protein